MAAQINAPHMFTQFCCSKFTERWKASSRQRIAVTYPACGFRSITSSHKKCSCVGLIPWRVVHDDCCRSNQQCGFKHRACHADLHLFPNRSHRGSGDLNIQIHTPGCPQSVFRADRYLPCSGSAEKHSGSIRGFGASANLRKVPNPGGWIVCRLGSESHPTSCTSYHAGWLDFRDHRYVWRRSGLTTSAAGGQATENKRESQDCELPIHASTSRS
ncbi:MAG: hypothetical protein GEEBNDBF_02624 [bacterium]|nr:hypothetical protein [bacterium]